MTRMSWLGRARAFGVLGVRPEAVDLGVDGAEVLGLAEGGGEEERGLLGGDRHR